MNRVCTYTMRCRVRTSTTRVSTSVSAYISLARVRVYTFALSQDRARVDVFVRSWDACYRRGWYAYPPIVVGIMTRETNCYNNFIYREGEIVYVYAYTSKRWRCVYTRWTWTDDHNRVPMQQPPASTLTT